MVYVREAHPSDAWQVGSNEREQVVFAEPTSESERHEVAQTCTAALQVEFPALVDSLDNATDEAYTGWPERLYLIGQDGRVLYKSGPGPFGFDPEELGAALKALGEV